MKLIHILEKKTLDTKKATSNMGLPLFVGDDDENKQRKLTQDSGIEDDERKTNDDMDHLNDSLKCSCFSSSEDIASYSPTTARRSVKKQRRMTPVPLSNTSKEIPIKPKNKFLFVEEEDADDIDHYNSDDDYIENIFKLERLTRFSRSWHDSKDSDTGVLQRLKEFKKAKSLDCGLNLPLKNQRKMNSQCTEKHNVLYDINVPDKVGSSPTCYAYKHQKNKTEVFKGIKNEPNLHKASLPLWMQEASENEMSSDTGDSKNSSDEEDLCNSLNGNKNKRTLLQDQKLPVNKKTPQKNKTNNRRRKITPSDSPCTSSLEKLSQLKVVSDKWKVAEEEEEEQAN
ncbi:uncharacterized protein LOC100197998 [Hydra vulgaris]|uniref:uncharacterized protein LOC100197998 n=1 Tax=Hydra vulgaris TaxID=6087 RepID=UPI0032EA57D5